MLYCYIAIISRLVCTNMELIQLARIETMCNDQGVIQDFRLGGGGGNSDQWFEELCHYGIWGQRSKLINSGLISRGGDIPLSPPPPPPPPV